jgi:hypothetical protein
MRANRRDGRPPSAAFRHDFDIGMRLQAISHTATRQWFVVND